jgi:pimeloyl-ACP methyl ester carboxylesterase
MFSRLVFFGLFVSQLSALNPQLFSAPASAVTLETGTIDGAQFTLARPAHWNQRVLLLAHGLREPDRPLVADLFPEHLAYKTFLDEGWIVAKTSYRRNGIIVADAIADLDALRAHIEQKFGTPERALLEGESMGGLIVTLIAERDHADLPVYAGVVAIGAALSVKEDGSRLGLNLQPQIPLLFLTNQSELDGSRAYVTAKIPRDNADLRPVLFRVSRDGHVNVNQRERLAALRALNAWLDTGRTALPSPPNSTSFFDATVAPEPQPSQVTPHPDGRGFDARVIEVSAVYGNAFINAQPADFAAAGIAPMTWFELTTHGQTYRVRYGHDFGDVKRTEWIAFPNADGFTWLARNYGDAAATAHLALGDTVTIQRYDESK